MDTSDKGVRFVARWEGLRLTPYEDAAGNATIGYGHLIHRGPVTSRDRAQWMGLTEESARMWLRRDLDRAAAAVRTYVRPPITMQTHFDALVSFAFNVGAGAFVNSRLLALLNQGHRGQLAADQLLRWNHAGGIVVEGLTRRRFAERALWMHGTYV